MLYDNGDDCIDWDDDDEYAQQCPMCGGDPTPLGVLGSIAWARCRSCGTEYAATDHAA